MLALLLVSQQGGRLSGEQKEGLTLGTLFLRTGVCVVYNGAIGDI